MPSQPPEPPSDEPDLLAELSAVLADPSPVPLLLAASSMGYAANVDEDDGSSPFSMPPKVESSPLSEQFLTLTSAMMESAAPETDALLLIWAAMFDDPLLRRRIHRAVDSRSQSLPEWLRSLDSVSPVAAASLRHELGHEETLFVEFSLSEQPVTMAVAVTRLGIPYLEDCYPIDDTIDSIQRLAADNPQMPSDHIELTLANARAQIEEFVDHGDHMMPPTETDTWPSVRLLLAWMLRLLPDGGEVEEPHEWTEDEIGSLVTDFLASSWAQEIRSDAAMHAERLFDFQLTHGSGEPLKWGATAVNMIMGDLYPRKVLADDEFMLSMPTVLAAVVRFANERSGTSPEFTTSALEAIDEALPEYRRRVSEGSSASGAPASGLADLLGLPSDVELPEGLIEQLSTMGLDPNSGRGFDPRAITAEDAKLWREELRLRAGGEENLASLDEEPLPAEDFSTDGISPKVLPQVQALAADLARFADAHFRDPEMTTAVLRILNLTARTNPAAFRRGFAHPPAIAALCWIAGKNNRWFIAEVRQRTIQTMMLAAGATTQPTARAKSMLKNVSYSLEAQELDLGDPALLTSLARADLMAMRDATIE
ncbi:MAG: hypothetical protein L0H46_08945 [Brevibacterium sp.]|nr:hypothetical protein [Brevibacterium sp.]MDN5834004.1 hypothetical protein [Brevibacterium sp.]MDN5877426.1 hypothetical protein [Brevibacterium sp.]